MWTRAMLKYNARMAFKKNYVNAVAVSLIYMILANLFDPSSSRGNSASNVYNSGLPERIKYLASFVLGLIIVISVIVIVFRVLVYNPIVVGVQRFFIENHYGNPGVGTMFYAFKTNYINIVKTMFLKDVYICLWALLFLVPGLIKTYSYRMVPFILAENPDMDADEAIRLSMEMMNGEKLNTFVLDISFLPWVFIAAFTFNIVGVFYVYPYVNATDAELYLAIKAGDFYNDQGMFSDNFFKNGGGYYG